jgi:hypothetical protein
MMVFEVRMEGVENIKLLAHKRREQTKAVIDKHNTNIMRSFARKETCRAATAEPSEKECRHGAQDH